jgi:CxxC-x17-CxxC domain-containing protein
MNDFKGGKRFGGPRGGGFNKGGFGRPSFGGGQGGPRGGRDFGGPKELFEATCANCGTTCEVPFKPNGKKPVYCKACFAAMGGGEERHSERPQRRDFDNREFAPPRGQFERRIPHVHAHAPHAHPPHAPAPDKRIDDIKRQLDTLEMKLDMLIETMGASSSQPPKSVPAAKKAPAKKAAKKK